MSRYLLISDVYCPWCYAFDLVLDRLLERHPLPVDVLGGELVDKPMSIEEKLAGMPNMRARFQRMSETTGQVFGQAYLDLLEPGRGAMIMDSKAMSVPLAAMRHLDPGHEREQLGALQRAVYNDGLDVLDPAVQARVCHVDERVLRGLCAKEEIQAEARADLERGTAILDEFLIYPTLYLEKDDGGRHLLARGYTACDTVRARLEAALVEGGREETGRAAETAEDTAAPARACGPDGCCIL